MIEIFDNIRKLYRFKIPCEALVEHIEFFSESSLEAMNRYVGINKFTVKLFPSFTPTIWLNLGTPYQLWNGASCHVINEQTDILLLRNEIVERRNLPTDNVFTIKFNRGGFEAIFGISQTTIGSDIIPVKAIMPESFTKKLRDLVVLRIDWVCWKTFLFKNWKRIKSRKVFIFDV
jgi:hypothetical protein